MSRFLLKLVAFASIQVAVAAIILLHYDTSGETNYLAATVDKHQRLAAQSAPRIILVGGSNVAFGFDTDRIETELGHPAINMGLAAGLGIEFMLSEIQPALKPGDVVVLSFEYDHFARGPNVSRHSVLGFDPQLLRQVLVFRPEGLLELRAAHFRRIVLDSGLNLAGEIVRRAVLTPVSARASENAEVQSTRRAFNAWGDLVGHRHLSPRAAPDAIDALPMIADEREFPSPAALDAIRQFTDRNLRNGIRVAFTFPPKPTGAMRRQGHLAENLADALGRIPGLILLDGPGAQTYSPALFFDTANHLTAEGAALRTRKVIASLRSFVLSKISRD